MPSRLFSLKEGEDPQTLPGYALTILAMLRTADPSINGYRVLTIRPDDTWEVETSYPDGTQGKMWGKRDQVQGMEGGPKYNILNPIKVLEEIEEEDRHKPREI